MTGVQLRRLGAALLCLLSLCLAQAAAAGQLKVSPIRLDLSAGQPQGVVTVGNTGSEPALIHVRVRAWHHRAGQDVFEESRDVLVNPMIFKLEPQQDQLIRVGLLRPKAGTSEGAYRMFIQEVPQGKAQNRRIATYLRISLPIFVAPKQPDGPILVWRAEPKSADEFVLSVQNQGNLHTRVSSLALLRQNGQAVKSVQGHTYVLAGQRREWVLPREALRDDEVLTLTAASNEGAVQTALRLAGSRPLEEVQR